MSVQVHIKAHMRNQETTEEDSWPAISLTWCENSLPMKNDLVRIVSHDHGNDPKCVHVDIDELRAALDSIDAMRKSKETF